MKNFTKKLLTAALAALMAVSVLTGCGAAVNPADYGTTVVATLGDEKIYLDEANMYLRSEQYYYEMMYTYMYGTADIWSMEIATGVTMADAIHESVMVTLRQTYILCSQAEALGVTLSAEDMAKVEESAKKAMEDNDEHLTKAVNMTYERMVEVYTKNALANRVWEALVADTDTNVSDEEARCVGASYVLLTEPDLDAEPKEGEEVDARPAKAKAQEVYDAVKAGTSLADAVKELGLEATKATYFVGDKYEEKTLGFKAIGMAEGAVEMFELESGKGWYVMVLDTLKDEDATQAKKDSIIAGRQAEVFTKKYAELQKASPEFVVEDKIWNSIPLDTIFFAPEETSAAAK